MKKSLEQRLADIDKAHKARVNQIDKQLAVKLATLKAESNRMLAIIAKYER